MSITVRVYGIPAPQGSKQPYGRGRVESSSKVKPWREAVKFAALEQMQGHEPMTGPVRLTALFFFPRPKSHYGTGRNRDRLKDHAPQRHVIAPDLDKLLRSTIDGLTEAGTWLDDSQVCYVDAQKAYPYIASVLPGAVLTVTSE